MTIKALVEKARRVNWYNDPIRPPPNKVNQERQLEALRSVGPAMAQELDDMIERGVGIRKNKGANVVMYHINRRAISEALSRIVAMLRSGRNVNILPQENWNQDARDWLVG